MVRSSGPRILFYLIVYLVGGTSAFAVNDKNPSSPDSSGCEKNLGGELIPQGEGSFPRALLDRFSFITTMNPAPGRRGAIVQRPDPAMKEFSLLARSIREGKNPLVMASLSRREIETMKLERKGVTRRGEVAEVIELEVSTIPQEVGLLLLGIHDIHFIEIELKGGGRMTLHYKVRALMGEFAAPGVPKRSLFFYLPILTAFPSSLYDRFGNALSEIRAGDIEEMILKLEDGSELMVDPVVHFTKNSALQAGDIKAVHFESHQRRFRLSYFLAEGRSNLPSLQTRAE